LFAAGGFVQLPPMTQPAGPPPPSSRLFKRPWTWWFMVATLAVVAGIRLRLLSFPLERDEGEYAYAGQLMLQGIPPYELAYNMKFPGLTRRRFRQSVRSTSQTEVRHYHKQL
jgi:hypothetical protein